MGPAFQRRHLHNASRAEDWTIRSEIVFFCQRASNKVDQGEAGGVPIDVPAIIVTWKSLPQKSAVAHNNF